MEGIPRADIPQGAAGALPHLAPVAAVTLEAVPPHIAEAVVAHIALNQFRTSFHIRQLTMSPPAVMLAVMTPAEQMKSQSLVRPSKSTPR